MLDRSAGRSLAFTAPPFPAYSSEGADGALTIKDARIKTAATQAVLKLPAKSEAFEFARLTISEGTEQAPYSMPRTISLTERLLSYRETLSVSPFLTASPSFEA